MRLPLYLLAACLTAAAAAQAGPAATPPAPPPSPPAAPPPGPAAPPPSPPAATLTTVVVGPSASAPASPAPPSPAGSGAGASCFVGYTYCGSVLEAQGFTQNDLEAAYRAASGGAAPPDPTALANALFVCQPTTGATPPGSLGPGCSPQGPNISYVCTCGSGAAECQNNPPWRIAYCACPSS